MKTTGLRRFDRMARYRLSAILFGIVYLFLWSRLTGWPDLPTDVLRGIYIGLTTPAMALLAFNVIESSISIYKARRRIDRMLAHSENKAAEDKVV